MESGTAAATSVGPAVGPLRRRAPAAGSPSRQAVVSPGDIPRPSGGGSRGSDGGRRKSRCHIGACSILWVVIATCIAALAFRYGRPSNGVGSSLGTPSRQNHHRPSKIVGSALGTPSRQNHHRPSKIVSSALGMPSRQNHHHRHQRHRPARSLGDKDQEFAPSNAMVKKKSEWDYTNRFPHFGSPEHNKACGGNRVRYTSAANTTSKETAPREESSTKCSVLVRPDPNGTEGLALWASNVVMGYFIHGQIAGGACKFYIDYGPGVDVEAALISQPSPTATVWSIPPKKGFDCRIDDNCHYIWTEPSGSAYRYNYRPFLRQQQLAAVPFYRFAYNPRYDKLNVADFRDLGKSLMGKNGKSDGEFNVHTGFACAFSSLFQLSPEAVRYEPNLFTHLLPTLQDPTALVIGIYIRTGATEGKASAAAGYEAVDNAEAHIAASKEILNCAQEQEIHFVKGKEDDESGGIVRRKPKPQRIVWMLVTDSRHLKEYVSKEYGGVDVVVRNDKRVGDTAGDGDAPTSTIPRVVLTTSSTGAHTRPKGAVIEFDGGIDAQRTEGFASAFIDWWLLGESDLTISSRDYTFGNTAAMRTARAVYQRVLERNDGGSLVNNACGLGRIT